MSRKGSYKESLQLIHENPITRFTGIWTGYILYYKEDFKFKTRESIAKKVLHLLENVGFCFLAYTQTITL